SRGVARPGTSPGRPSNARPARRPAPAKPPPAAPAQPLDTRLRDAGLGAANVLQRAGRRLGFLTVRELLFHLPRRYDDLREMRKLGDLRSIEDGTGGGARGRGA